MSRLLPRVFVRYFQQLLPNTIISNSKNSNWCITNSNNNNSSSSRSLRCRRFLPLPWLPIRQSCLQKWWRNSWQLDTWLATMVRKNCRKKWEKMSIFIFLHLGGLVPMAAVPSSVPSVTVTAVPPRRRASSKSESTSILPERGSKRKSGGGKGGGGKNRRSFWQWIHNSNNNSNDKYWIPCTSYMFLIVKLR